MNEETYESTAEEVTDGMELAVTRLAPVIAPLEERAIALSIGITDLTIVDTDSDYKMAEMQAEAGQIRFVVIDPPGRASVRPAALDLVQGVIERCCRAA